MWDGPRGAKSRGKAMNPPGKLEKGLAIVLLLLSTGAFLNLFLKHGKFAFRQNAGLPFMQVIWSGLYLLVLFLLIKEARGFWRLLLRGWTYLLLLTIYHLTIGCSVDPTQHHTRTLTLLDSAH